MALHPKPYKGDCPFGPDFVKHLEAARLLKIRPKDLTQLPFRRAFHQNSYVYPLSDILEWAARLNPPSP
jgi:hypothetical protein